MPTNTKKIKGAKVGGECLRPIEDNNFKIIKIMGATRKNATIANVVASTNNNATTNVVAVSNIVITDLYLTKYDNNIVVQTNGNFVGINADNTTDEAKGNFLMAPLRLLKESSKDLNVSLLYALVSKHTPSDILLSLIKLVLLNSIISIKRTFVPKGTNEGQENDRWHTEITSCGNTRDVMTILPIIQMQLSNAAKMQQQPTSILNAFNI